METELELRARIAANDRLLKALITLLSIRDPDLLQELETVFAIPIETHNDIGEGSRRTWEHIRYELGLIRDLSADAGKEIH
jgi:hypothetical protein